MTDVPTTSPPRHSTPAPRPISKLWPWLAAIGSGVLLAFCFAPWDFGALSWIALTPLIWAACFASRRPLLLGYVSGLIYFTAAFQWLSSLGQLFQQPALLGIPLLLSSFLALYPATWTWIVARVIVPRLKADRFGRSGANLAAGAFAASAWTALEWVRGWLFSGFSWDGLGVALHRDLAMIQIADITGTLGLTWLIVFVNVMAVIVVSRIVGELGPGFLKRVRWEFSVSVSLIVIVFSYGIRQLLRTPTVPTRKVQIAAVQPNIPQEQKFDRTAEEQTQDTLERLTVMAAAMNPDLILWPEASTARGVFSDQANFDRLEALRAKALKPILVGTVEETLEDGEPRAFNSAMLLPRGPDPLKEQPPTYRKIHRVPFGEYLPLRPILNPIAGSLVPGDIDAGTEVKVFSLENGPTFAALICFEDTDGDLTRQFVTHGADLLINITNDGWFLRTCGSQQHLDNAVLRAVETHRPMVRCGNSGITCIVHPTGYVERWLEPFREGFAVRTVELYDVPLTFYTRHGDWIAWICSAITVAMLLISKLRRNEPLPPVIPQ